jgi:hypothetical protein
MAAVTSLPLALFGQWHGAAAVVIVLTGALIFLGSVFVLLTAIYGWREAYLVEMVALSSFIILLSMIWVIGIPGTLPGTGPRGTEPHWVPFLADSEQGQEFAAEIRSFDAFLANPREPSTGWRVPEADNVYPGKITPQGEADAIKGVLIPALAGYYQRQGTGSSNPADYDFVFPGQKPTPDQAALPQARGGVVSTGDIRRVNQQTGKVTEIIRPSRAAHRLVAGFAIPATKKHPAIRAFAFRDQGRIFQPSLMFFGAAVVLFALHLWLLARMERRLKEREAAVGGAAEREPAGAVG